MTKQEIIEKIAKAVDFNATRVLRDTVIRGEDKIISEATMFEYWNNFGELKRDVVDYIEEYMEDYEVEETCEVEENEHEAPCDHVSQEDPNATKSVTIVPFQAMCREVRVPAHWSLKQILDAYPDLKIDVETGMWDIRINGGGDDVAPDAELCVPKDGDFIQVATHSKGN